MSQVTTATPTPTSVRSLETTSQLLRQLLWLSIPVLAENMLHMVVGLNDTYLANHVNGIVAGSSADLDAQRAAAASAVGAIPIFSGLSACLPGQSEPARPR